MKKEKNDVDCERAIGAMYHSMMSWEAWVTLGVVVVVLTALWRNVAGPDVILMGGATVLATLSLVSPAFPSLRQLASNFGNEGVLTVAVMLVVAAALTETGGIRLVTERLIGRPKSTFDAQVRLMLPVTGISAFLNNTPVVAMFMPVVDDLCKKFGFTPSKLFIPLSYASILGGVCTLIGTSTNLVVQAMLVDANRTDPNVPVMGMFTLTPVGIPVAIGGLLFIAVTSRWLLPARRTFRDDMSDPRQYTVEMRVQPGSPIAGKTIEEAGLRHLQGVFLTSIERDSTTMAAVGPDEKLREHDQLVFVGVVDSIVDLQRVRGLLPAARAVDGETAARVTEHLFEVVVSDTSPLLGRSIREGQFRSRYDAVVIAVYRNGGRIASKVGDIVLQPGDTLLVQAERTFAGRYRNNRDFLLVSAVDGSRPVRHERGPVALLIMAAMVVATSLESWTGLGVFGVGLIAAALMGVTGCLSAEQARKSIDLPILVAIVAALVIGQAVEGTGLAGQAAAVMIAICQPLGTWAVLAGVYALTLFFTEIVTNNAAAALAFPIAAAVSADLGVNLMPFVIVVAIAASAGFATPLGYQTHLMVYGPGGYRFSDFAKIGLPLDLVCMVITVVVAPMVYPF
jgi:di/tricarboxylate transporter